MPSAGRYFSHTPAYRGVSTPAAAAAGTAGHLVFPAAAAAAGRTSAAAAAAATSTADQALSATWHAATVAIQQPHSSSSSSSRLLPGLSRTQGLNGVTQRQGFIGTAGLILREEGPTAFTRGIQVCLVVHWLRFLNRQGFSQCAPGLLGEPANEAGAACLHPCFCREPKATNKSCAMHLTPTLFTRPSPIPPPSTHTHAHTIPAQLLKLIFSCIPLVLQLLCQHTQSVI